MQELHKWFDLSDSVNMISIIGAIVIVLAVLGTMSAIRISAKNKTSADVELSEHEWDGIGEYKNPLPIGWAVMFVVLICFAAWYWLAGYPLSKYSSIGEYNEELAAMNAKYGNQYASLSAEDKQQMGEGVFLNKCAACHGIDASGMNGKAQDLTRWGGETGILHTLANGSTGLGYGEMPAGLVDGDDAKAIAHYVAHGFSADDEAGSELFAENCASCHGENGEGTEGVAPNLQAYSSVGFLKEVLHSGKEAPADAEGIEVIGAMPSFEGMLSEEQMDALARYVHSLKDPSMVAELKE